jgi:hypothetical protein
MNLKILVALFFLISTMTVYGKDDDPNPLMDIPDLSKDLPKEWKSFLKKKPPLFSHPTLKSNKKR